MSSPSWLVFKLQLLKATRRSTEQTFYLLMTLQQIKEWPVSRITLKGGHPLPCMARAGSWNDFPRGVPGRERDSSSPAVSKPAQDSGGVGGWVGVGRLDAQIPSWEDIDTDGFSQQDKALPVPIDHKLTAIQLYRLYYSSGWLSQDQCLLWTHSREVFQRLSNAKLTWRASSVTQSCLTLCNPMDYNPVGSSVPWDSPGKNPGVGCHFLLQGVNLPDPGIEPIPPALAGGFFTTDPPGKP